MWKGVKGRAEGLQRAVRCECYCKQLAEMLSCVHSVMSVTVCTFSILALLGPLCSVCVL